jgi:hypothetical protein
VAGAVPGRSRNTIYQIVRHVTFWLDAARLRIVEGRDVDPDQDWAASASPSHDEWTRAIERLEAAHGALHAAIVTLDDARLEDPVPGSDPTIRGLLLGILQHNAYHTGQIVQIARELA